MWLIYETWEAGAERVEILADFRLEKLFVA